MVVQLSVSDNLPLGKLVATFGPNISCGVELAQFASYRTGGRAKYFIAVKSGEELARAIKGAKTLSLPYFILGGGTNILISDTGFDGLIIRIELTGMKLINETEIECHAGEALAGLVDFAAESGLSGLEFAAGIYGTVGGAIFGNAGAYGGEIGSIVETITVVDGQGKTHVLARADCGFDYRHSRFKESGEVIVSARLKLKAGEASKIRSETKSIIDTRLAKLPSNDHSAGCFFKNVPDASQPHGKLAAGKLLDDVGAKGLTVGEAAVSNDHANIIVNSGRATSKEIDQLADKLKKMVQERFGITLIEEVVRIGKF